MHKWCPIFLSHFWKPLPPLIRFLPSIIQILKSDIIYERSLKSLNLTNFTFWLFLTAFNNSALPKKCLKFMVLLKNRFYDTCQDKFYVDLEKRSYCTQLFFPQLQGLCLCKCHKIYLCTKIMNLSLNSENYDKLWKTIKKERSIVTQLKK